MNLHTYFPIGTTPKAIEERAAKLRRERNKLINAGIFIAPKNSKLGDNVSKRKRKRVASQPSEADSDVELAHESTAADRISTKQWNGMWEKKEKEEGKAKAKGTALTQEEFAKKEEEDEKNKFKGLGKGGHWAVKRVEIAKKKAKKERPAKKVVMSDAEDGGEGEKVVGRVGEMKVMASGESAVAAGAFAEGMAMVGDLIDLVEEEEDDQHNDEDGNLVVNQEEMNEDENESAEDIKYDDEEEQESY